MDSHALIGSTVLALMRHRDQLAILQAEPDLVPSAIEEVLRCWAPFFFTIRETTKDVEVEGVTIPKGSIVTLMISSGNFDDQEFDDAATFDIRRQNRHMSFGYGVHFCVGAHLARLERARLRIVLEVGPQGNRPGAGKGDGHYFRPAISRALSNPA